MKKNHLIIGFAVILFIGSGWKIVNCYEKYKQQKSEIIQTEERVVKLLRVGEQIKNRGITYPGKVRAVKHAELFFRVSGPVIERNLKYGQTVNKGDILMRIDPRDYQREVDRLSQELEVQKVQHALAVIEYNRYQQLRNSNAISQADFDTVAAKKDSSEAQLKMLDISLKIARDHLEDTVLKAPFYGTISNLLIEQYEIAQANKTVVSLDDLREVEIKISIPAGNLPNIGLMEVKQYLGKAFEVTFPGRGENTFWANIYEIKPIASDLSETYEVTLRMPVPENFLILPGMSAEVHNLPSFYKEKDTQIALPFAAIFKRNNEDSIWIYDINSKKIIRQIIQIDRIADADHVYVFGNVKNGDFVVAAGGDWLTENTSVRIMNPEVLNENH